MLNKITIKTISALTDLVSKLIWKLKMHRKSQ